MLTAAFKRCAMFTRPVPRNNVKRLGTRSFYDLRNFGDFDVEVTVVDSTKWDFVKMSALEIMQKYQGKVIVVRNGGHERVIQVLYKTGYILNSTCEVEQKIVNDLHDAAIDALPPAYIGDGDKFAEGTKAFYGLKEDAELKWDMLKFQTDAAFFVSFHDDSYEVLQKRVATSKPKPNWHKETLLAFHTADLLPVHTKNVPKDLFRFINPVKGSDDEASQRVFQPFSIKPFHDGNKIDVEMGEEKPKMVGFFCHSIETKEVSTEPFEIRGKIEGTTKEGKSITPSLGSPSPCAITNATFHTPPGKTVYCFSTGEFQPIVMGDTAFSAEKTGLIKPDFLTGKHSKMFQGAQMMSCSGCVKTGELFVGML